MVHIQDPDYETVSASCEHCGALCVFNRIDDIGEVGPYAGRYVTCLECRNDFHIYGDIVNPAYQLFIFDAYGHFQTKRYMRCVASLAQGWEIFFSTFIYSRYLYRPFFANPASRDIEHFNRLSSQLHTTIRKYSFNPLRNVLVNTMLNGVDPQTLQESEVAIPRISAEKFSRNRAKANLNGISSPQVRKVLNQLQGLQIGELRNKVVHQHAYRPRRAEVEPCCEEEVGVLYRTKQLLRIGTFEEYQAGVI